jgi:ribonucleoside-diphosphate reductase alpha chain
MMQIQKRDGRTVPYDRDRIYHAIEMAWRAELRNPYPDSIDSDVLGAIEKLVDEVEAAVLSTDEETITVELVQDRVEEALMRAQHFNVARRYILYREARHKQRGLLKITGLGESTQSLSYSTIHQWLQDAHIDIPHEGMLDQVLASLPSLPTTPEIFDAMIMTARTRIELIPEYSKVAMRLLRKKLEMEVNPEGKAYVDLFIHNMQELVNAGRLSGEMAEVFDFTEIGIHLDNTRDELFDYLGLQTLYDRYFLHVDGVRKETPQMFWMRVAMGLSLKEDEPVAQALDFYEMFSTFRYCPSTPTLFNSGTINNQMSSCYLTSIDDSLESIFDGIKDNAKLQKLAGGIGNDWTNVRGLGAWIKGTNGPSQGIIPFLNIADATAIAVNQGSKRKGAVCAYLEPWHLDVEEFLDLRKNTGDDRRRTHDMHTALWIPDLFMERVQEDGTWTLFSPDTVHGLHSLYGADFRSAYELAEAEGRDGAKQVSAVDLWRKIMGSVYETGHPWITFKDRANERNTQKHEGTIHSSNLCTEILLNTKPDEEIAVCNLASINLITHVKDDKLDLQMLAETIHQAVRGLDNVIDNNLYPVEEAERANTRHRPIGLGLMGWQDVLHVLDIPMESSLAVQLASQLMEVISYEAISASANLADERGAYPSFAGSSWSAGELPYESAVLNVSPELDWSGLRDRVRQGVRNSNILAIAPTATIANIQGVSQSIEPQYSNLYVKSNLSGEFTTVNQYLVDELRELGIWDTDMLDDLKYHDGSVQEIDRIPDNLKLKYKTAFEIDPVAVIQAAAARQCWIDMGQSLNLYVVAPTGRELSDMYFTCWNLGLKTTYYLRSKGATSAEKSTLDINKHGVQPKWMTSKSASSEIVINRDEEFMCEVCQ